MKALPPGTLIAWKTDMRRGGFTGVSLVTKREAHDGFVTITVIAWYDSGNQYETTYDERLLLASGAIEVISRPPV